MVRHYEAPYGPERIPFSVGMAFFAMGAMPFFKGCFFVTVAFLPWILRHFSMPRPSK